MNKELKNLGISITIIVVCGLLSSNWLLSVVLGWVWYIINTFSSGKDCCK